MYRVSIACSLRCASDLDNDRHNGKEKKDSKKKSYTLQSIVCTYLALQCWREGVKLLGIGWDVHIGSHNSTEMSTREEANSLSIVSINS